MKNRWIARALVVASMLALFAQGSLPARAEASAAPRQAAAPFDDEYAWIEFLTDPVFLRYGPKDYSLRRAYNAAWYYDGNESGAIMLSPFGRKLSDLRIDSVCPIIEELWAVKPYGSDRAALYRDGKLLTSAVYERFLTRCGCVYAFRDEKEFDVYDREGNRIVVDQLPAGYEPLFITPAGTVVAGKRTESGFEQSKLFDRNGTVLYESGDEVSVLPEVDWFLTAGHNAIDLQGNLICRNYVQELLGAEKDILCSRSAADTVSFYGKDGSLLSSVNLGTDQWEWAGHFGNALIIRFRKPGSDVITHTGLACANGVLISDPAFTRGAKLPNDWQASGYSSTPLAMPEPTRALFGDNNGTYRMYDDQGTQITEFQNVTAIQLYLDCVRVENAAGTQIYDIDGNLKKTYTNGEEFFVINGIHFLRKTAGGVAYIVDLSGNRLSQYSYKTIADSTYDYMMYGLLGVKRGNAWYIVNAAGIEQNTVGWDQNVISRLSGANTNNGISVEYPLRKYDGLNLGVYYQNGCSGLFRYVPAVGACAKAADGKHNWEQEEVVYQASCAEQGMVTCRCSSCGKTKVVTTPKDETRHVKGSFVKVVKPVSGGKHGTAKYKCAVCGKTFTDEFCTSFVFRDMPPEDDPAHMAIDWAYTHKPYQVTAGMDATHFGPERTVTRAQAMTFFWAAKDKPKPKTQTSPFLDVKKKDWYYKPVLWAVENGITAGTDATHFSPNKTCNRGEILTFLYAAVGKPKVKIKNPYQDVTNQWYKKAALWAWVNRIERGENGKFNASTPCTRASTVTYLYRFLTGYGLVE